MNPTFPPPTPPPSPNHDDEEEEEESTLAAANFVPGFPSSLFCPGCLLIFFSADQG